MARGEQNKQRKPGAKQRPQRQLHWHGYVWGLALSVALLGRAVCNASNQEPPFHIGFSWAAFGDVNENDATAAVRAWAQTLAQERGIPADPQPQILRNVAEITKALTNQAVDCISLTTEDYAALRSRVRLQNFVVAVRGGSITEEYVLLVHRDSGVQRLGDLRGRKFGLLQSSRAALVPVWLDTLLAHEGLGLAADFCGSVVSAPKISKVVLPVFFRQLDACVVTRRGFDTMIELNPQTGQQLKVLAASPPVVPVVFCFRADYDSPVRTKVLAEVARWHTFPAGRQILTLFQSDSLEERPQSCLDSALDLLAAHERLCSPGNSGHTSVPSVAIDTTRSAAR